LTTKLNRQALDLELGAPLEQLDGDNEGKKTKSFHEGGNDYGVYQEAGCHFRLAGHSFKSSGASNADADTRTYDTYCGYSRTNQCCSFDKTQTIRGGGNGWGSLSDECVLHFSDLLLLIERFMDSVGGRPTCHD
jgi:hypothetical protein